MMALRTFGKHSFNARAKIWQEVCVGEVSESVDYGAVQLVPFDLLLISVGFSCEATQIAMCFLEAADGRTHTIRVRTLFWRSIEWIFESNFWVPQLGKNGNNTIWGPPWEWTLYSISRSAALKRYNVRFINNAHRQRHTTVWPNRYANDISKSFHTAKKIRKWKAIKKRATHTNREQKSRLIYSNYTRQSPANHSDALFVHF